MLVNQVKWKLGPGFVVVQPQRSEKLFNLNSIILALKKPVNSKIRICLDCGSTLTVQNEKTIICKDCGNIRFFPDLHLIRTVNDENSILELRIERKFHRA